MNEDEALLGSRDTLPYLGIYACSSCKFAYNMCRFEQIINNNVYFGSSNSCRYI